MAKSREMERKRVEDRADSVDNREVEDITLDIFYKPHTISLLVFSIVGLTFIAFYR